MRTTIDSVTRPNGHGRIEIASRPGALWGSSRTAEMCSPELRTVVIGVGNTTLRDDGVGPLVAREVAGACTGAPTPTSSTSAQADCG